MAHWRPAEVQHKRALDKKRHKALYDLRRASGICVYCGKNETNGKAACKGCVEKRSGISPRRKTRYKAASKIGICVSCNKAESVPGRKRCGYCLEYHQEATERFRVKAKARGRCSTCFSRHPDPGYKTCAKCKAISKQNKIRSAQKKRTQRAVAA